MAQLMGKNLEHQDLVSQDTFLFCDLCAYVFLDLGGPLRRRP